jgi:flagellar protein FlgJ
MPLAAGGHARKDDDPAKVRDAAQQFEALLIGQILRSVRESGGGWLGSGSDASSDCATEYAEQHFAATLAQQGGLGLADLISKGLQRDR